MKKRAVLLDGIRLLLALFLTVGCQTFLHACLHDDGSVSTCHYAQQVLTVLGGLTAVWAALGLLLKNRGVRSGLALAAACVSLVILLIPGMLIPLCMMSSMRCNLVMLPAVRLTAIALLLLSLMETGTLWNGEEKPL